MFQAASVVVKLWSRARPLTDIDLCKDELQTRADFGPQEGVSDPSLLGLASPSYMRAPSAKKITDVH